MARSSVYRRSRAGPAVCLAVIAMLVAFAGACDTDDVSPNPPARTPTLDPEPSVLPSVVPLATCETIFRALPAGIFVAPLLAETSGGGDLPHSSLRNCTIVDGTVVPLGDHAIIEMERLRKEGDGTAMVESLNRNVTNFARDGCGTASVSADATGLYRCSSVQPNPAVTGIAALASGDRWVGVKVIIWRGDDASRRKAEEAAAAIARAAIGT